MSYTRNDAAADATKSTMNRVRRQMEQEHGEMLCCHKRNGQPCDNVAAEGSCYCDDCEQEIG